MPKIEFTTDLSNASLQVVINAMAKQERKWRKTGRKRDLYRYLGAVFSQYATWKCAGVQDRAAKRLAKVAGLARRQVRHPIRVIIDATSTADRRTKSRWCRALRYAWRGHRRRKQDLFDCLDAQGGITGCASRWADLHAHKRTPPGYVRVGGEDRFPKIPFFIGKELLNEYGDYL